MEIIAIVALVAAIVGLMYNSLLQTAFGRPKIKLVLSDHDRHCTISNERIGWAKWIFVRRPSLRSRAAAAARKAVVGYDSLTVMIATRRRSPGASLAGERSSTVESLVTRGATPTVRPSRRAPL